MAARGRKKSGDEEIEAKDAPSGSALAERHRRTSKHRVPRQTGKPPAKKQRTSKSDRAAQQKLPFREAMSLSRVIGKDPFTKRLVQAGSMIVAALLVIGGMIIVYQIAAGSKFFSIRTIELEGNSLITRQQVETLVDPIARKGMLRADLDQIRDELKKNELISEVRVNRVLPDILHIRITERVPYTLARRSDGSVVCVDREGSMFGDQLLVKNKPYLPMITGLAEDGQRAEEINRQRLLTYRKLIEDLDGTPPPLSSKIDEVIFDDVQGVRLILGEPHVAVFVGNQDFRTRLNAALDVLDAIKRKDAEALNVLRIGDAEKLLGGARIAYLNATIPKRIIVGLDE